MKFVEFLENSNNSSFWSNKKVICFVGQDYPFLFFCLLFENLNKNKVFSFPFKKVFLQADKKVLYSTLKQRFLGQDNIYWLGNSLEKFSTKNIQEILKFFSDYKGPHYVSFFLKEDLISEIKTLGKDVKIIEVDNDINSPIFIKLLSLFGKKFNQKKQKSFNKKICDISSIQLDIACMLMQYFELINTANLDKFDKYLSLLLNFQGSLRDLSQYFFAKKPKQFFYLWKDVKDDYSDMFWIAYWSDQIWRAYFVVKFLNQKDIRKARRVGFRLPAAFIKSDYRKFSLNKLQDLYEFLYNIDFSIKKGSSFCSLDLFYFNYFIKS